MHHEIACTTSLVNSEDSLQENITRNTIPEGPKSGEGSPGPEPDEVGGSENGPEESSSEEPPLLLGRPISSGRRVGGASADIKAGGRPSNTSPADYHAPNKINTLKILCGGIDTLELSAKLTWEPENILETLGLYREVQKVDYKGIESGINDDKGNTVLNYTLLPQSTRFMTYILHADPMTIKLQKNPEAKIKHNCEARLSSELLWEKGLSGSLEYFEEIMGYAGASVNQMTVSRADLCIDILVPERVFKLLPTHYVTLAKGDPVQYGVNPINSFYLGMGGDITIRLYDKAWEIESSSGKEWMKQVWGLQEIPKGFRVMRIEVQIRRDTLREFGVNTTADLQEKQGEIWKYITEKWLQYKENPMQRTARRRTSEWWEMVQNGYPGSDKANPCIRSHITKKEKKRRYQVARAAILSLHALQREEEASPGYYETVADAVASFALSMKEFDLGNDDVTKDVMELRKRIRRTTA